VDLVLPLRGGTSTKVPNLSGLTVDEATARAAELGLTAVVDTRRTPSTKRFRSPRPGAPARPDTAVKEGQTVRLFLSLGRR